MSTTERRSINSGSQCENVRMFLSSHKDMLFSLYFYLYVFAKCERESLVSQSTLSTHHVPAASLRILVWLAFGTTFFFGNRTHTDIRSTNDILLCFFDYCFSKELVCRASVFMMIATRRASLFAIAACESSSSSPFFREFRAQFPEKYDKVSGATYVWVCLFGVSYFAKF